ncbi:MAG TPA: phosphatase PAP2 family protein [Longimicrobiales bacterium]|nr:phosphatase PAP2 family protein [Longimicrobiales bacterium]
MLGVALLAGSAWGAPAAAQAPAAGSAIGDVPADAWFITRSPAQASASDLGTAGLAALGAGVALLLDEPVHDWLHSEPFPVRVLAPFGEDGPLGFTGRTTLFLLPLSLALWTAGHVTSSPDLRDAGLGCGTSNLTTTLTRRLLASLLGRLRPEVHEGAFRFQLFAFGDWEARSFFGGHASNIMSCAAFFNHRFDMGPAGPALYAFAGGVGAARIVDEAHWTSDTYTGMVYGYAVGRNVAQRSLDRSREASGERSMQPMAWIGWRIRL